MGDERPIECKHCDRIFAAPGDLIRHHRAKHPDLPEPKWKGPPADNHESEADRHVDRMLFGRWP